MHGLGKVRWMGGILLAFVITLAASDPPEVFGQKKGRKAYTRDSSKSTLVTPTLAQGTKLTADQLARHIDQLILARLNQEKVEPSALSSDEEFLRRVYLDITGKIPTTEQALAFLDSKESNKRVKLIDELLASKDYGRHMADIWQALLLPRTSDNLRIRQYFPNLTQWLETKFNENVGWDAIASEILTASGPVDKSGPAVYFLANNTADKVTDNVSRMFLGVQLQCAQCHNHPFTDWKQDEYWGMAAFFLKVRPDGNPNQAAKQGKTISISESNAKRGKRQMLPESAKILPPKYLQGDQPKVRTGEPLRPHLANWLTTPSNPFFAKAMVNRVWAQFFGRGIINPVDDMHEGNAASHPELLADLAQQFAASGFDVKHLIRAICTSDTYQRSSKPKGNNLDVGPELFARMAIKPLTPEQMYDALTQLMGNGRQGPRARLAGAGGRNAGTPRDAFIAFFSAEDGADATEYHTGIPQVLRLMNAPQFNNSSAIGPIVRSSSDPKEAVDKLYLTVLARRPTAEERERVAKYLRANREEPRSALAGVLWALMNSSEFALNR